MSIRSCCSFQYRSLADSMQPRFFFLVLNDNFFQNVPPPSLFKDRNSGVVLRGYVCRNALCPIGWLTYIPKGINYRLAVFVMPL